MTGWARWGKRRIFERSKPGTTGSFSPASGAGAPVMQATGWSIAIVLLGGILAVFTTRAVPSATLLQQGTSAVVPVEQAGPSASGGPAPLTGEEGIQALPAAPASTSTSAPHPTPTAVAKTKGPVPTKPAPPTTAKAAPAAAAALLQPAPGSYALRISGTSSVGGKATTVPTSGSLVVESRGGDQQQRTVGVPGGLVLVQRANAAGADLVSFSLTASSRTLSFAPPAPVAFIRTAPGSWTWSARSTDGTVNLSQTATVFTAGPVNVGGTQVPAVTVQRVFSVSGAVQGTVQLTTTVSLVDRLPLVQHQVINITASALGGLVSTSVVSDSTATLTSTSPR